MAIQHFVAAEAKKLADELVICRPTCKELIKSLVLTNLAFLAWQEPGPRPGCIPDSLRRGNVDPEVYWARSLQHWSGRLPALESAVPWI